MASRRNLRLASFDGGGIRCFSQLQIMQAIMHQLLWKKYPNEPDKTMRPHEHFDLMGGSETGGLLVVMFVKLHLSVEEAMDEFGTIYETAYANPEQSPQERSSNLRQSILELLNRRGVDPSTKLVSNDTDTCSGFVVASPAVNVATKICFRTYHVRTQPSSEITILDAVLATCSSQPEFAPLSFGAGFRKQIYVGPSVGFINPCREVTFEAQLRFGNDTTVGSIISFGSGHPGAVVSSRGVQASGSMLQLRLISCEQRAQEMTDQLDELEVYYRFSVPRGMDATTLDPGVIAAETEAYLTDFETVEKIGVYAKLLEDGAGIITLDNLGRFGGRKAVFKEPPTLVPYHIRREEPRARILQCVLAQSTVQKIIVVAGMGGCGKTQLITEVVQEHTPPNTSTFKHVFFVNGNSKASIQADIVNHVRLVGRNPRADLEESMNFLQNPTNLPLMLVLDNVDDVDLDLAPLLPTSKETTILITTRNQSLGLLASDPSNHIRLDVMTEEEARQLILRCSRREQVEKREKEAVDMVTQKLGYLPVALAQAGHYMAEAGCSATQYHELLNGMLPKLMDTPSSSRQKECAYATFDISHKALSPSLQNLVHLLSFFHFADIPTALFALSAKEDFSHDPIRLVERGPEFDAATRLLREIFLPDDSWSELTLWEMARTLQRYSIISVIATPDTSLWRLHPLFREWAYDRLQPSLRPVFRDAACRLMVGLDDIAYLGLYVGPHIESVVGRAPLAPLHANDTVALSRILTKLDRRFAARGLLQPLHDSFLSQGSAGETQLITVALELGKTWDREDYDGAENFKREAIRLAEKACGADSVTTLRAKRELAYSFITDRWNAREALPLLLDIQQGFKTNPEANNEDLLTTESILASAYVKLGRRREAEEIQTKIVARRQSELGPLHHLTLQSMQDLGETYAAMDQPEKAEKIFTAVLESYTKQLGSSHLTVAWVMNSLAGAYDKLDRYQEAEALRSKHLDALRQLLGEDHGYTSNAVDSLANTYNLQGHYKEAISLHRKVLESRRLRLGSDHIHTLDAMRRLADVHQAQGEYAEAEALHFKVLEGVRAKLGEDDEGTLWAMHTLAQTYQAGGKYGEARALRSKILQNRRSHLGEDHQFTIDGMYWVAQSYRGQGNNAEAEALWIQVLDWRRKHLDEDHWNVLGVVQELGAICFDEGRYSEAEEYQRKVYELGLRPHDKAPAAAAIILPLARTLCKLGRQAEAETLALEIEKIRRETAGADDSQHKSPATLLRELEMNAPYPSEE